MIRVHWTIVLLGIGLLVLAGYNSGRHLSIVNDMVQRNLIIDKRIADVERKADELRRECNGVESPPYLVGL